MEQFTTTPFGRRPVTAGLLARAKATQRQAETPHFDKWQLFRDLCTARHAFELSDRDLTVLNALLSFHKDSSLSDTVNLVVYPSNNALADRAHGMAESTLRRHLAALVRSGVISRHDSPNGKRYAARNGDGTVIRAFGFDLRPLLVQARQITHAAAEARAAKDHLKRLREEVSLLKRDTLKLAQYGRETDIPAPWEAVEVELLDIHKRMRRNLLADTLQEIGDKLRSLLGRVRKYVLESEEVSGSDALSERHYQSSNLDSYESEYLIETEADRQCPETSPATSSVETPQPVAKARELNLPLGLVLKACPDILPYARHEVQHWHDLVALAGFVRGMLGISPDAWEEAQRIMGAEVAAVTVAAILQRVTDIRSPGGYLRSLTTKAASGGFSPGPMVMALLCPSRRAA